MMLLCLCHFCDVLGHHYNDLLHISCWRGETTLMWGYRVPLADSTAWEPWKPRSPPQDSPSHIPQTRPDQITPDLGQSMVDQNPTTNLCSLPFRALQACRCVSHTAVPVYPSFAFLVLSLPLSPTARAEHEIFSVSFANGFDEISSSLHMPDLFGVSTVTVQMTYQFCMPQMHLLLSLCLHLCVRLTVHLYFCSCVYARFCLCAMCVLSCNCVLQRRHTALNACVYAWLCVSTFGLVFVSVCVCILDLLISCGADRGLKVPDKKKSSELGTGCRDVVLTECRHIYIQYTGCVHVIQPIYSSPKTYLHTYKCLNVSCNKYKTSN